MRERTGEMQYQAVFFDFDYTLGDCTPAIVAGFRYAFERMGWPEPGYDQVRHTVGFTLEDGYTALTGDAAAENRARFRELYTEKAGPMQVETAQLCPGALELLTALSRAGVPVGVVSTKRSDTLKAILEARGALGLLASVTGGDQVNKPKPDPEGLLAAIAAQGLTPEQVLYCGDTTIDAQTAQGAGAHFCAVLNGTTGAEDFLAARLPCEHIAPDLWDLKQWLGLN